MVSRNTRQLGRKSKYKAKCKEEHISLRITVFENRMFSGRVSFCCLFFFPVLSLDRCIQIYNCSGVHRHIRIGGHTTVPGISRKLSGEGSLPLCRETEIDKCIVGLRRFFRFQSWRVFGWYPLLYTSLWGRSYFSIAKLNLILARQSPIVSWCFCCSQKL